MDTSVLRGLIVLCLLALSAWASDDSTSVTQSPESLCAGNPPDGWGGEFLETAKTVCPHDLKPTAMCVHADLALNQEYQNELYTLMCKCMTYNKEQEEEKKKAGEDTNEARLKDIKDRAMESCEEVAHHLTRLDDPEMPAGHKTVMYWSGDVAKSIAMRESQQSQGVAVSLEGSTIFGKFFNNGNADKLGKMVSKHISNDPVKYNLWGIWNALSRVYVQLYGPHRDIARNIVVFGESIRSNNAFITAELPELVKQQCDLDLASEPAASMSVRFVLVDNRERMNRIIYTLLKEYLRVMHVGVTYKNRNVFSNPIFRGHSGMEDLKILLLRRAGIMKKKCTWDGRTSVRMEDSDTLDRNSCMHPDNFASWLVMNAQAFSSAENSEYWQALNYYSGGSRRADETQNYSPLEELKVMIARHVADSASDLGHDLAECVRAKAENLDDWFHAERFHVDNTHVKLRPDTTSFRRPFEIEDPVGADPDAISCVDIDCYDPLTRNTQDLCLADRGLTDTPCCTWHEEAPHCRNRKNFDLDQVEAEMNAARETSRPRRLRTARVEDSFEDSSEELP